jgi:hypothetical protein
MNFQELTHKLKMIDEGVEMPLEECGNMMPPPLPKQSDSVTMNVSMNGSGPGGIKDLLDILRNIDHATGSNDSDDILMSPEHDSIVLGGPELEIGEANGNKIVGHDVDDNKGHDVKNRPHRTTYNIDTITRHGDDMHSKGDVKRLKVAGGENPMQEGLVSKLHDHYQSVKARTTVVENVHSDHDKGTLNHILHTYKRDVMDFEGGGEMSQHLFDALYDYYFDDMPYGVKKARDGDPYQWVADRFEADLGINEEADPVPVEGPAPSPMSA